MRTAVAALALLLCGTDIPVCPPGSGRQECLPHITRSIADAVEKSGIPGAAVVAVDRDRVVYAANFGSRDVDAKLPVTPATRFYIASSTKPFTALTAMLLANEGKLDVDAPVDKVLPDLHLPHALTFRDLMTHRLGFQSDAAVFRTAFSGEFDTPTLYSLIANRSKTIPRSFNYSNLGYVITAYAIEKASGESWKDAVAKRVLTPLGLSASTTHIPAANTEVAVPYVFDGAWRAVEPKSESTMHAAGGIYSTAADLARFIRMEMNHGGGIFPRRVIDETQSPQIHLSRKFARYDRFAYGLGWYLSDYDGDLLVHHFGGFRGAQAHMSFMPDRNLGVVVLTNNDGPLAHSIASFVYDSLLKKADAAKRLDEDVQRFNEAKAKFAAAFPARVDKLLAAAPADAVDHAIDGTYIGDYGTMVVRGDTVTIGVMSSMLEPHGRAFIVHFAPDDPTLLTFKANGLVWDGQEFARQ